MGITIEELTILFNQVCDITNEMRLKVVEHFNQYDENQLQDLVDIQFIGVNGERISHIIKDDVYNLIFESEYNNQYYLCDLKFEDLYYIYTEFIA